MNNKLPLFINRKGNEPRSIMIPLAIFLTVGLILTSFVNCLGDASHDNSQAPAIDLTKPYTGNLQRAMFAGGCFWGTQYSFQQLPGVVKSTVGYAGGKTPNPTYQQVCGHTTGHAETVYLEFDPKKLSYKQLVEYFWTIHDPTTQDRQGFDIGDNYRSVIFYTNKEQKLIAEESKKQLQLTKHWPIVTQIVPATLFYPAEEYHQNYDVKHGSASCPSPVAK